MTHKSTCQWEKFLFGCLLLVESILDARTIVEYSTSKIPHGDNT